MTRSFTGGFPVNDLPRMLDSRYRLDAKLGEGGMGVVYRGMNVAIERAVAIKVLRAEYCSNEGVVERFLREARSAVRIGGAHVVEILDFGAAQDGAAFFVMELLEGISMSDLIRREKRLDVHRAVKIGAEICLGLHAAHEKGIVHRDLKPPNVMLIKRGANADFVKILDFGVAKLLGEAEADLTKTGMLLGTVDYMAPEQIQGQPVDARTDIYAFGGLMYRALSGTKPFSGDGLPAMIYHHINSEPESLLVRVPEANIPRALDRVVRRCMAKEPSGRYADMLEVRAALMDAIGLDADDAESAGADDSLASVPVVVVSDWVREVSTFSRARKELLAGEAQGSSTFRGRARSDRADGDMLDGSRKRLGRGYLLMTLIGMVLLAGALVVFAPNKIQEMRRPSPPAEDVHVAPADDRRVEHAAGALDTSEDKLLEPDIVRDVEPRSIDDGRVLPAPIVVDANVTAARVFVDGTPLGAVPATYQPFTFDPVSIRVVARGHVSFESEVTPASDELVVHARLRRARAPQAPRPPVERQTKTKQEPRDGGEGDFLPMDL